MKINPLIIPIIIICCNALLAVEPIVPKGWQDDSDFDETEELLQKSLGGDREQMPQLVFNRYIKSVGLMEDAKLLSIYMRLFEKLGAAERTKLFHEQTLWLAKREENAKLDASADTGGSLEIADYWMSYVNYTKKRQHELLGRLSSVLKTGSKKK